MKKYRILQIPPVRFGVILGLIVGFIAVLAVPFLLLAGAAVARMEQSKQGISWLFYGGGVAVMPVACAVAGFLAGVFLAMVYNLAVRWTGGIEIVHDDSR
jgi:hypothetical protein